MRPLELVLLGTFVPTIATAALTHVPTRYRRIARYLPLLAAAAHVGFEGARWQLAPAYALAVLVAMPLESVLRSRSRPRGWALFGAVLTGMVVAFTGWLGYAFPVFRLPVPTGDHPVGVMHVSFLDPARPESLTSDPRDTREVIAWVWYPAKRTARTERQVYWEQPRVVGRLLAKDLELPPYFFDHVALVRTHSHRDAPPSDHSDVYPVVLFSHGYGRGFFAQNSAQMEELASHGYVVVSIVHPYEALATLHPDGRVILRHEAQIGNFWTETRPGFDAYYASHDLTAQEDAVQRIVKPGSPAYDAVRRWTEDTQLVLDVLERQSSTELGSLAGRLDPSRVGIFGHSFGGSVAIQVCIEDPRCRAGVNLDGIPYAQTPTARLERPFMFMYSDRSAAASDLFADRIDDRYYRVGIAGTVHSDFTDFTLLMAPAFKWFGDLGPIDGRRMTTIVADYLVAFFNEQLLNQASPLLQEAGSPYPEVTYRRDGP